MNKGHIVSITEKPTTIDVSGVAKELFTSKEYEEYKGGGTASHHVKETAKKVLSVGHMKKVHTELIIDKIAPELANALQRASVGEQDSYGLSLKFDDIETDDKDMNRTELLDNINLIPLRYGITDKEFHNVELSLDIRNDSDHIKPVLAGDLKISGQHLTNPLFQPTIELIYLRPGCRLIIKNITMVRGNIEDHAKFLTATNGSTWPLDRPADAKTSNMTPMKHSISFVVNNVLRDDRDVGRKVLIGGCLNLLDRLSSILEVITGDDSTQYLDEFKDHCKLELNETNSIAKMFERTCYTLYPDVEYVSGEICYHTRSITMVVYGSDAKNIMIKTFRECIKFYEDLLDQIQKK